MAELHAGKAEEAEEMIGGSLHGSFVEINGSPGDAEVRDQFLRLLGFAVDPNGRQGWASWEEDEGAYAVATLDGLVVVVPEEHLQECEPPSKAGGCDALWPSDPELLKLVAGNYGALLAQAIQSKGYCQIRMPFSDKTRQDLDARSDYTLPKVEFEESYLGNDHSSKVLWLDSTPHAEEPDLGGLPDCFQQITKLCCVLSLVAPDFLGVDLCRHCSGAMLRRPLAGSDSRARLSPGPLSPAEIEEGLVEVHLDFVQRRTLCLMYFYGHGQGTLELRPRDAGSPVAPYREVVKLQTACYRLLVFRHDLFSYSYSAGSTDDLVLQTWLLEEPQRIRLEGFEGEQLGLTGLMGSPALALESQVHVKAANCTFPGEGNKMDGEWSCMLAQTDTFVKIPALRFDIDQYYEAANQFNATGKSSTCHAGLISDATLIQFDNEFFGIPADVAALTPCIQRVLMEVGYECLCLAGHNKESLRGSEMYICIADIGIEWDNWFGFQGMSNAWLGACTMHGHLSCNRFCYTLGIQGKCHQVDTACSASLVAANCVHALLRDKSKPLKEGMSMGQQHILQPWPFVGLSAAGMLGSGGRCKTFDQSANGYNRGEGCGGLFCHVDDGLQALTDRMACFCGSYINQDGRSASLTAPNGPSQQMVIRGSLQQAQILPEEQRAQENHGTGTALGDPIETGTIRAVYRKHKDCLQMTSGKSHMGHLEAGAGSVGILKTLLTLLNHAVPAQVHLRHLNAHCEMEGFPGMIPVERCDMGWDYSYAGCNGFGFGGTNTHADFWAQRRNATHQFKDTPGEVVGRVLVMDKLGGAKELPPKLEKLDYLTVACSRCLGSMCWLCGAALPSSGAVAGAGKHRCSAVRTEPAGYRQCSICYGGTYQCGDPGDAPPAPDALLARPGLKVFLAGTFNAWSQPLEMERQLGPVEPMVFEGDLVIGETLMEEFHILVRDGQRSLVVHPVVKRAQQRVRVVGPARDGQGKRWLIDSRRDGQPEGAVYRVRFSWGDGTKLVTWSAAGRILPREERYVHTYQIVNSLSNWRPAAGSHDSEDRALFRWFSGRIPASGQVPLLFVRDFDMAQMVYPLWPQPKDESVPVMGPDAGGDGKRWLITGEEGEALYANLRIENGEVSLRISSESMAELHFHGQTGQVYSVAGSWSNWKIEPMLAESPETWRCRFELGYGGKAEFQIVVNQNWNLRLYPPSTGEAPGASLVCGPDRRGKNKNWEVRGFPGQLFDLVLDLAAEDQHDMVRCWPSADDDGLRALDGWAEAR